jgi:hypothetical protein
MDSSKGKQPAQMNIAPVRTYTYRYPFRTVTSAQWAKYPNPWSPHIISIDSFHRSIDQRGTFINHRIISTKNESNIPSFVRAVLPTIGHVFTWEKIEVNPQDRIMIMESHNQTASSLLDIKETCTFQEHPENPNWTLYSQVFDVNVQTRLFRERIKHFVLDRLQAQAGKGSQAMEEICERVNTRSDTDDEGNETDDEDASTTDSESDSDIDSDSSNSNNVRKSSESHHQHSTKPATAAIHKPEPLSTHKLNPLPEIKAPLPRIALAQPLHTDSNEKTSGSTAAVPSASSAASLPPFSFKLQCKGKSSQNPDNGCRWWPFRWN